MKNISCYNFCPYYLLNNFTNKALELFSRYYASSFDPTWLNFFFYLSYDSPSQF